jgi:phosphoglycolate phosphatase
MKKYRVVVFDWDGTVMDSTHGIVAAMQGACADLGLPVPDVAKARWVIGLSIEAALYHVVPDLTQAQMPGFLKSYRTHFLRRDAQMVLFAGVRELFSDLAARGVLLAVATGKSRAGLDRVLAAAGLTPLFACTRCADETAGKPDPAMLREIQQALGVDMDQMVMVGDTSHDIQMAVSAGADSVAVTYGAHDKPSLLLAGPTTMVNSVAQLRDWLLERV